VAKNAKLSRWGSILGAPLEVAAEGDVGRSCGGANDAAMGAGWSVCETRGKWLGVRLKYETEPLGLDFGCAVGSGGGG
jgi:hypothetical protein